MVEDVLVVADSWDELAWAAAELIKQSGRVAEVLSVGAAARRLSVRVGLSNGVVHPDLPTLLRIPSLPPIRETFDASFEYSECVATLWAAGALSNAPWINRPGVLGMSGRYSSSAAITELRAGLVDPRVEVFSRELPTPPRLGFRHHEREWVVQDAMTYETSVWPKVPRGSGPYRARFLDKQVGYELVTVVGSEAWRATEARLEHLCLEERSINIMARLGLTFGTVIWSITPDLDSAVTARVDPCPEYSQLLPVWTSVGPALVRTLLS